MLQARSLGALAWNMMGEEPAEEKRNPERTSPLPVYLTPCWWDCLLAWVTYLQETGASSVKVPSPAGGVGHECHWTLTRESL